MFPAEMFLPHSVTEISLYPLKTKYTFQNTNSRPERERKFEMLPLKLVRSLVLGETISNHHLLHHNHLDEDTSSDQSKSTRRKSKAKKQTKTRTKTPALLFTPTRELITDTYRLSSIARHMGMDLHPTPSLSHIIFSYPSSKFSSLLFSSSSLSLPDDAIPLPFPSLITASDTYLHSFANLSKGLFKIVYIKHYDRKIPNCEKGRISNWESCLLSLFSRITGEKISTMDGFTRVLTGMGWSLYKSNDNSLTESGERRACGVYLYRKVEPNSVGAIHRNGDREGVGEFRIRELRLPLLDFKNAPLRILQYIILMTDDLFHLA